VVALEPAPDCFACLRDNIARHAPGVVALPIAAADRSGPRDFVYYPNAPEQSTLHVDADDTRRTVATVLARSGMTRSMRESMIETMFGRSTRSLVQVQTVSEVLAKHVVDEVALLKVDVERAELEVLRGVEDRDWPRIRRVAVEVHDLDGRLATTVALLRGVGYAVDVTQSPIFTGSNVFGVIGRRA
jgi:FkbM family methyltransferase